PTPVALVFGSALGDDGCTHGGPALRIERAGAGATDITAPAPPLAAWLRHLSRGALATWLAPLGCGVHRPGVWGVGLDVEGAPIGAPIQIANATTYAIATNNSDADLWIQDDDRVTWVRMTCVPP